MDRRQFVRTVSAGLAALPVLETGGWSERFAAPRSRVAVVKTTDRKRGVHEAIECWAFAR